MKLKSKSRKTPSAETRKLDTIRKRYKRARNRLAKDAGSKVTDRAIENLDKRIARLSAKNRPKEANELKSFIDRQDKFSRLFQTEKGTLKAIDDAILADAVTANAFFAGTKELWYGSGGDLASYEERKEVILTAFQQMESELEREFRSLTDIMEWLEEETGVNFLSDDLEAWERYKEASRKAMLAIASLTARTGYVWH